MVDTNESAKAQITKLWLAKRMAFINVMKDQVLPLAQEMQEIFPLMCEE